MIPLLFWDVDTQVDFMREHGKLYVPDAEAVIPNLRRLTEAAREHAIPVIASADDHELGDAEISDEPDFRTTYPPHCLRGTPGVERIPETERESYVDIGHEPLEAAELARRLEESWPPVVRIHKKRFDVFTNPNTEPIVRLLAPEQIVVYGVALDVCNRYAIEGLLARRGGVLPRVHLALVTDATRAIRPEEADSLLAGWKERGVELVTTEQVLAGLEGGAR